MKHFVAWIVTPLIAFTLSSAAAETVEYSASIDPRWGTYTLVVTLPQFDPALGSLTKATLFVNANSTMKCGAESLNQGPSQISMSH